MKQLITATIRDYLVVALVFTMTLLSVAAAHPLIPGEFEAISISRLTEGVEEADRFRREMLRRDVNGRRQVEVIARACLQFQANLEQHASDRVSLKGFRISQKQIVRAIEGSTRWKRWERTFGAFQGKWYGRWDQMEVDHHWYSSQSIEPEIKVDAFHDVYIRVGQFAWVGDGYGWNLVCSQEPHGKKAFILGSVYHVQDQDPTQVTKHRPHVGISCGDRRIIWITRGEIFFEERFAPSDSIPERYAITGFKYTYRGGLLSNQGNAFQAVYTRNPEVRPAWRQFWVGITAK